MVDAYSVQQWQILRSLDLRLDCPVIHVGLSSLTTFVVVNQCSVEGEEIMSIKSVKFC